MSDEEEAHKQGMRRVAVAMLQEAVDQACNAGMTNGEIRKALEDLLEPEETTTTEDAPATCVHAHHKDCHSGCPCFRPGQGGLMIYHRILGPKLRPPLAVKTVGPH